jgi:transposase
MDAPPEQAKQPIDLSQAPRLRRVDRSQVRMMPASLDESLPAEHDARLIWEVVTRLNFEKFEATIAARGSAPGRAATDPRILAALLLYAAIKGEGSGREIDRLVRCDDGYRWLAGGVTLDYHIINDFRVRHDKALDDLFTQVIASLVKKGLVNVTRLTQDGLRVRASAGTGSFRREASLLRLQAEAKEHLEALKKQNDPAFLTRQQARQLADAEDRAARLQQALDLLPELRQAHEESSKRGGREPKPEDVRVSMTDPDARKMKMPDGGYRPAYNVQLAADPGSRAIVGVGVTSEGVDTAQATPMRGQVEERTDQAVKEHLVDGGFASLTAIEEGESTGVKMYAPVSNKGKHLNPDIDPHDRKKRDTDHTFAWRQRMATEEAKTIYKQRGSTIETINADLAEHRGLRQFPVRGPTKARCIVLWLALAYNIMHFGMELIAAAREMC